jgi:hypothetical protein
MRILLIDPPGKNRGLNTGLGYLCAALDGIHETRVLDLNNIVIGRCGDPNPDLPPPQLEMRIARSLCDFEPQIVGISVKTFTAVAVENILGLIRKIRPAVRCIVGGPHVTLDGLSFIPKAGADFGMRGEGEYTFAKLCDALEQQTPIDSIEGLLYSRAGEIRSGPDHGQIEKLDDLKLPNYRNFSSVLDSGGRIPEYPLLTSRGCPHRCSYCSMPEIMGGKWRYRDPAHIVEEIRQARTAYKSTSFTVVDDNLTLNSRRMERICDLLASEARQMPWNSQNGIRADRVTPELARKMKRSGCKYVWVGIESADPEVFAAIDKGESLEHIQSGIAGLREAGIGVGGFFILGLPGSTRESDLKIIDFVRVNKIEAFLFNFVPYPKTRASQWVAKHAHILRASEGALQYGGNGIEPTFDTPEYPRDARIETFNEINVRLGYFDRLVDPAVPWIEKWNRTFQIVRPYGPRSLFEFLLFTVRSNASAIKNRIASQSFTRRNNIAI